MAARRSIVKWIGGLVATALGVAIAVPAGAFLSFPTRKRTVGGADEPGDVGELERLPEGQPTRVPVRVRDLRDAWTRFTGVTLGAVWLQRDGAEVRALSTVCPHAGCAVDWEPADERFACPCHDSVFDPSGARVSGPAPRGMDPLDCAVKDGRVLVTWRRYRQGVAGKEET